MKRGNHSKSRASKGLVLMLALVLVFGVAVGGTIAWLTDKTDTVTNTFTTSKVAITLTESETDNNNARSYKMIPGETYTKDPLVTVLAGSEACWVFVKMDEVNAPGDYLTYSIDTETTKWLPLEAGVWYKQIGTKGTPLAADEKLPVLTGNEVMVNTDVTNEEMAALVTSNKLPQLKFTAYAVQQSGFEDVADAWDEAKKLD